MFGAVLLDPDLGDAELWARLLLTVPETQLREDQSDLANWTRDAAACHPTHRSTSHRRRCSRSSAATA